MMEISSYVWQYGEGMHKSQRFQLHFKAHSKKCELVVGLFILNLDPNLYVFSMICANFMSDYQI